MLPAILDSLFNASSLRWHIVQYRQISRNFRAVNQPLFIFPKVRHLGGMAVHALAYQVPRQIRCPPQGIIPQMGITLRHSGAFVSQETLQDIQIDFAR